MAKVVSIIPPKDGRSGTRVQGTKVLLDNGEYLDCINKITLVAEPMEQWKAIIEVYPSNQAQIDAILADVIIHKREQANGRLIEIQQSIQKLQDEQAFLERNFVQCTWGDQD